MAKVVFCDTCGGKYDEIVPPPDEGCPHCAEL